MGTLNQLEEDKAQSRDIVDFVGGAGQLDISCHPTPTDISWGEHLADDFQKIQQVDGYTLVITNQIQIENKY